MNIISMLTFKQTEACNSSNIVARFRCDARRYSLRQARPVEAGGSSGHAADGN